MPQREFLKNSDRTSTPQGVYIQLRTASPTQPSCYYIPKHVQLSERLALHSLRCTRDEVLWNKNSDHTFQLFASVTDCCAGPLLPFEVCSESCPREIRVLTHGCALQRRRSTGPLVAASATSVACVA
eukprot:5185824-Amphidinium_carterae.2